MIHKITLNTFEKMRLILHSGTSCFSLTDIKPQKFDFLKDIKQITKEKNITTLVNSYRKVQHKYYPEKDSFKNYKKEK